MRAYVWHRSGATVSAVSETNDRVKAQELIRYGTALRAGPACHCVPTSDCGLLAPLPVPHCARFVHTCTGACACTHARSACHMQEITQHTRNSATQHLANRRPPAASPYCATSAARSVSTGCMIREVSRVCAIPNLYALHTYIHTYLPTYPDACTHAPPRTEDS